MPDEAAWNLVLDRLEQLAVRIQLRKRQLIEEAQRRGVRVEADLERLAEDDAAIRLARAEHDSVRKFVLRVLRRPLVSGQESDAVREIAQRAQKPD